MVFGVFFLVFFKFFWGFFVVNFFFIQHFLIQLLLKANLVSILRWQIFLTDSRWSSMSSSRSGLHSRELWLRSYRDSGRAGLLVIVEMFPLQSGGFILIFPTNSIPGFRPGEDDQHKLPKFTQLSWE